MKNHFFISYSKRLFDNKEYEKIKKLQESSEDKCGYYYDRNKLDTAWKYYCVRWWCTHALLQVVLIGNGLKAENCKEMFGASDRGMKRWIDKFLYESVPHDWIPIRFWDMDGDA